jgi:hypothetical protein
MDRLSDVHFINLIVDAGTVYQLKSSPCILTNPHASEQPELIALRENRNFTIQDYCDIFCELIAIVNCFGMIRRSIVVDNLPVQVSGLGRALQMSDVSLIHVKCFCPYGKSCFSIDRFHPTFLTDYELSCRSPKVAEVSASDSTTRCKMSKVCSDTIVRYPGYAAIHFKTLHVCFRISV